MSEQIEAILSKAFGIPMVQFTHGVVNNDLLEYFCFRWISWARECAGPKYYEHVKSESAGYSDEFVAHKLSLCPDLKALDDATMSVNLMVSGYGDDKREIMIGNVFYVAHRQLMIRDFGALFESFDSECYGITREAEEFQTEQEN
ncbi:hypothetical protein PPUJ20028_46370 [Pseudomonas putida]|uniref:Uncharacterized protein n=1 Tax=Pseudomonas putida TaxID=303 RepID=A0AA37RC99_PSEPU|nr:hypothetical protein [Pseudomonas putida]GLO16051.1 hypothetical protein PPUJ20028_46370 [Pseudomonas putida]GLO37890.1 hypothetical protein PPUN14671_47270 [Pseudomonas putida]HDS0965102.1 hypothetical protein [Pseudomonas putida]HDS0991484.1 hypothetical protein [Pseudomonas putida]